MLTRESRILTSKGARAAMDAAIAKAEELGITVTIAIVDAGGHLIMLERMTGGRFHTVHTSTAKAVTAASNRRPTGPRGAQGQPLDVLEALSLSLAAGPHNWTPIGGGYPIVIHTECVGGIGVSGGTQEQDQVVTRAALSAVGALIEE